MRKAEVLLNELVAGVLIESETDYTFQYNADYLLAANAQPVSLTLPLREMPYTSKTLFPFFDGLIPEGWLLAIAERYKQILQRRWNRIFQE